MILHPLFSYPTIVIALITFSLYFAAALGLEKAAKYAFYMNILLIILLIPSILFGFSVSNVPLVQSKAPFIWSFPHKWNGILLLVFSVLNLVVFWLKGERIGKKFIILPILGLLLTFVQLITGWMLRLVFFS